MNPWQKINGPLASYRQVPVESLFSKHTISWRLLVVIEMIVSLFFGCAAVRKPLDTEIISPTESPEAYVAFWSENKRWIDQIYADDYSVYPIIVDTASGSRDILTLIDPEAAKPLMDAIVTAGAPPDHVVRRCYRYVVTHFRYLPSPDLWPTVRQTLKQRSGDCKGLSLLLMSLLTAADIDASAEISNGHMWVRVDLDGTTTILETDQTPGRQAIYNSPGFYDRPLLRVTTKQTLRRIRK
jgi:transglutaminase-like putative cysteine protease